MIKAVLFDLDGTLLPLDYEVFFKQYITLIGGHVAHVVTPKLFVKQLLASTAVMVANSDPAQTNEQVFAADFFPKLGLDQKLIESVLNDFYCNKFPCLAVVTNPNPAARQAVQAVLDRGLKAVVATNPIFPLAAIQERLRWAGVSDLPFCHLTCFEQCHFCKPNPAYYLEVASSIGLAPEECLMVGNDVEEDLCAATVGMKTFLVTDCLLNFKGLPQHADKTGTLEDLVSWLKSRNLFEGME